VAVKTLAKLLKLTDRQKFFLLLVAFIVSRFFFTAKYPFFYDSPEYLKLSQMADFSQAIVASHESVHPVYIFLIRIFQRITPAPTSWELSLTSCFFGLLAFLFFYLIIRRLFGKKNAIYALIPLIFLPHLWLIQTNILHESLDSAIFLLGFLFFDIFLERRNFWPLILSMLAWGLAFFNFPGISIWFIWLLAACLFRAKKPNSFKRNLFFALIASLVSIAIAIGGMYLLFEKVGILPGERIKSLVFGYGGNLLNNFSLLNIARVIRNDSLVVYCGYGLASVAALFASVVFLLKKRDFLNLGLLVIFLLPFLLTGNFWYGGLYGRYGVLLFFAIGVAFLIISRMSKWFYWLLVFVLLFSFLPTFIHYQKKPLYLIEEQLINNSLPNKQTLLVLSDYQRPFLNFPNAVYITGDENIDTIARQEIDKALLEKKEVLITKQAITFPYWQYDGQEVQIISEKKNYNSVLSEFLANKKLTIVSKNNPLPILDVFHLTF
jgi:hypothetical protein